MRTAVLLLSLLLGGGEDPPDREDPAIVGRGKEPPHATLVPRTRASALRGGPSAFVLSLDGR